ncbi:Aldo keto reductase [Coniophora puteana RWD-64-598 SS2]|uniref:Aldo keto reductase n=1 Tax=Coniophora puteana (strain RWD-64-598) TaxID=741705 RepID=A0A5M3ME01_CONPW|nr:Aldo keto reductase [Coniophora puteana RWD-64-598 SS2]EIW77499.1 Aldo keto reductase [Coniophora puteana RWD-64-598 SS2]
MTDSVPKEATLTSGYKIPTVGLGVYQNTHCAQAVTAALKHGYTHVDSARLYHNETQVGVGIKASGVDRSTLFITSKAGSNDFDDTESAVLDSIQNLKYGLEGTREPLGSSDYYDLFLLHSPHGGKEKRLKGWRGLLEAKRKGLVRSVGVSNYGPKHIEEIREAGLELPAVNQVELHPLDQQKPIVEYCKKHNILVQAYTPLLRFNFSGDKNGVIQSVADKLQVTAAQVLVRWSLQHDFVPLPKSEHEERIKVNAQVYGWEIPAEDMARLDALDKGDEGAVTWNPIHLD